MSYLILVLEFMKIGLFSVGGGLATIPFLLELTTKYDWFNQDMLLQMIAISESTPGPLGINMATFAGYQANGVLGAIIAPLALVLPSLVIIILVAKAYNSFKTSPLVIRLFKYLRPITLALIVSVGLNVIGSSLFDLELINSLAFFKTTEIIIYLGILILAFKYPLHPIAYLAISMVLGIIFKL